ncbi:hypothetical protein CUMW_056080 [Citrus unshiu]|nr:hypothetical protein CUMW_056080 [Citrus unshiu]
MALTRSIFAISILVLSMMAITSACGYEYDPNPYVEKPEQAEIEGAVARITCLANDEHGYEAAPFSILSDATDAKGYFFATLSPSEVENFSTLKECKAFLELSPSKTYNVPTNINNGTAGALLSSYRTLNKSKMILFSVPPFFYRSNSTKAYPNGY